MYTQCLGTAPASWLSFYSLKTPPHANFKSEHRLLAHLLRAQIALAVVAAGPAIREIIRHGMTILLLDGVHRKLLVSAHLHDRGAVLRELLLEFGSHFRRRLLRLLDRGSRKESSRNGQHFAQGHAIRLEMARRETGETQALSLKHHCTGPTLNTSL